MNVSHALRERAFIEREEAEAYLNGIADSITNVDFAAEGFAFNYVGGSIGACALHRGSTSQMSYRVRESGEMHFLVLQRGGAEFRGEAKAGRGEAVPERTALLLAPEARGQCVVADETTGISLITTEAALRRHAAMLLGEDRPVALGTAPVRPLDMRDPVVAALSRNLTTIFREMQVLSRSGLTAVAQRSFDEMLLGLALVTASSDARNALQQRPAGIGSSSVRRAREFMNAHPAQPISLAELAQRLGIGLRSLQLAFRREVGCTPREYLLVCRLEIARARLLSANEGATVTQIALECGFTDLAVFARKYREHFGERPSETLRAR